MDLSFVVQFFSALYILKNHQNMENKVYLMPNEINIKLANIKLASLNTDIDKLTQEQHDYLHKA